MAKEYSVKKENVESKDLSLNNSFHLMGKCLNIMGDFYIGIAESSTEFIRTLNNSMDADKITVSNAPDKLINGINESNVSFFKNMSEVYEKISVKLKNIDTSCTSTIKTNVDIDYEHLAKLVAKELQIKEDK